MKKERLFYLDFIRALATIMILLTHYNARYLFYYMNPAKPENAIISLYPFHLYIGDLGVALFFIISGVSLMYVYHKKCELKQFYSKRFQSIYPMFWITYFIAFLYFFFCLKHMIHMEVPKQNFILTILGLDGYLFGVVPSYYILGEWFLGCIILMYLIFPLLRKLLLSHPWILCIGAVLIYIPFAFYEWFPSFSSSKLLFVRIPELIFGMIFIWKIKESRLWMAIIGVIILACTVFFNPALPSSVKTTYIGISFFIVLVYISKWLDRPIFRGICRTISKYSYAAFLTHHVIIDELAKHFPMADLSRSSRYLLFILYICITALVSWLVYQLNARIIQAIRNNPIRNISS
ncbi:acyltransferase [Lacrimispora sp. NSJ-141]|uniref:Acyltransferase n=1 Tax=Lientehia hominis TaxID=2897778 RepID=A0AAP2RJQ8_9FIRM|nr:acyltransferase [Lientehia hominis]MCD2492135.1 acyltransferase [Lientehia hominis]